MKSNASLSAEEKGAKKALKKKLKLQTKIDRLEKQIRHSISRNDPVVEKEARENLRMLLAQNGLCESDPGSDVNATEQASERGEQPKVLLDGSSSLTYKTSTDLTSARELVLSICDDLFARANEDCEQAQAQTERHQKLDNCAEKSHESAEDIPRQLQQPGKKRKIPSGGPTAKAKQTQQAVMLLGHMTKGTQSGPMFRNRHALWGYTRKKFKERALLLYRSLRQLGPDAPAPEGCEGMTREQAEMRKEIWKELANVNKACSVGCGPGNDAVGLLTFLSLNVTKGDSKQSLPSTRLLDCFIDDWRPILAHLQSVLDGKHFFETMFTGFCDVTKPFDCDGMSAAQQSQKLGDSIESGAVSKISVPAATGKLPYDIYLFSYILSETRGKWDSFMLGLLHAAKPGSMFYFAEPVSWMLHHLMKISGDILDFLWLDSSMHYPSMQALDGRVGPAVLFARKKQAS